MRDNKDYPDILTDLSDQLARFLASRGLDQSAATAAATAAAEFVRQHWGGQKIYLPKGLSYRLSRRDVEIYRKWTGRNRLELCREYGLTEQRLYQIISAMRDDDFQRRQGKLL